MLSPYLNLIVLWVLAFGDAFVLPPPRTAFDQIAIVRHRKASDTSPNHFLSSLSVKAVVGEGEASTTENRAAKQRFLRNLERKRAGESVPSSVLKADLTLLRTPTGGGGRAQHDAAATTVTAVSTWRGKWEICYAPHIETLSKFILTKFGSVEYIFDADDGRMVSHAGFESKVFGSGWFNADGRVVPVPPVSSSLPGGSTTNGFREEEARQDVVVKVRKPMASYLVFCQYCCETALWIALRTDTLMYAQTP